MANRTDQVGFLHLPVELRLLVYSHISPLRNHLTYDAGLFLSCKLVYAEVSEETLKDLHAYLAGAERKWDTEYTPRPSQLNITKPTTIAGLMNSIVLSIPVSLLDGLDWEHISRRGVFAQLTHLYVSELTISLHEDRNDETAEASRQCMEQGDYGALYMAIFHILYQGKIDKDRRPIWKCDRLRIRYDGASKGPQTPLQIPFGLLLSNLKKTWVLEHVTDEEGAHLPEILGRRRFPHTPRPLSVLANNNEHDIEGNSD